uniref:Reverse transcriptase domain-containing protein n=1 Tax=Tanacetum cinerariifolium TaxID=118510 RepID=A0A6L2N3J3_TANCI|nr:reverse transcriptase domain-containing protein [Tanacetum cinerariifolium]
MEEAFAPETYSYSHDSRVFDYNVDPRVPLILERPLLRTARALIDVHDEELTLRVNDEAITFKVSPWVIPVHCVPKKGGMTVVENEDNELIPTRQRDKSEPVSKSINVSLAEVVL